MNPSSLLGEFKRQAGKRAGESLLRSCEPEIQELMRQIDLLLENKQSEWEKRTGDVRRQLERREDELSVTRAQLERKTAEADRLHSNLGELSEVHCEKSRAYDSQLKSLKGEMDRLSCRYEKIRGRKDKKTKSLEKEKDKLVSELSSAKRETQHVRKAFEELHGRSLTWSKEKERLDQQLQKSQSEIETLLSQCSYLQECNETYERDLERKRQLQDNIEKTHSAYATQMAAKLKLTEHNVLSSEDSVSRLKSALEETLAKLNQTGSECESLHVELARAKDTLQKLNSENEDLHGQLNSRETRQQNAVQKVKAKYEEEVSRLRETLQLKAEVIRAFEETESRTSRSGSPTHVHLREELVQAQSAVRTLNQREKELIKELKHQLQLIESYKKQISAMKRQASNVDNHRESFEEMTADLKSQEMTQLRERVFVLERENDDALQKIERLRSTLSSKKQASSSLLAKCDSMKKDLEMRRIAHGKTVDELRLANSQLDVLRLENQRLRTSAKVANAEKVAGSRVEELNASIRSATVATLEKQNQRLQSDVLSLQATVASLDRSQVTENRRYGNGVASAVETAQDTSVYVANSSTEASALLTEEAISQDERSIPVVQVESSSSGDGEETDEELDEELEEMLDAHIAEFKSGLEKTIAEQS